MREEKAGGEDPGGLVLRIADYSHRIAVELHAGAAPVGTMMMFLMGAVMLIVGMGFFSLGADIAMMPMGDAIGGQLAKSKKVGGLIAVCLLIGVAITVAEPDLQVLARQVPPSPILRLSSRWPWAWGCSSCWRRSRSLLKIPLRWVLLALYAVVFLLAFFIPKEFLAVAFDSGGVTTGPITVPFSWRWEWAWLPCGEMNPRRRIALV